LKKFSFNFSIIFFIFFSKIDEEFPSCFQNMTRLTSLELFNVRGSNPEPIPFPTQFCNMIYLKKFSLLNNNFSGFVSNLLFIIYILSSRFNSNQINKISWDEELIFIRRTVINRFCDFKFILLFLNKLGEFPIIEGTFNQLTYVGLPIDFNGCSTLSSYLSINMFFLSLTSNFIL